MTHIVICSMCGAQTEADKKFCPACGAPIKPSHASTAPKGSARNPPVDRATEKNVPTGSARNTLVDRLQDKKDMQKDQPNPLEQSEPEPEPTVTVPERKERPKTFTTKPLGVAKPASQPTVKGVTLNNEIQEQLIEFLRGLNRLDRNLEASAVVRRDGSLLASAHSSRVKPNMMATICSTLFGIAEDSIRAISGGKMRIITITAQTSVLMLKPINEDTILLLVTSPNSNIGLISMNSELVAQNIADFLAKLA